LDVDFFALVPDFVWSFSNMWFKKIQIEI